MVQEVDHLPRNLRPWVQIPSTKKKGKQRKYVSLEATTDVNFLILIKVYSEEIKNL
jgi:hypothetical protein